METVGDLRQGISDSLQYYRAGEVLYRCKHTHRPLFYSFWLTGVIFIGSLLVYNYALQPLLQVYPRVFRLFTYAYYLLWVFPVYLLSFVLNGFLYGDIALSSFKIYYGMPRSPGLTFSRRIALELHRGMVIGVNLVLISLVSLVPYTDPISIVLFSCLYSFYCFEHRWVLEGKTISKEVSIIEHNIAYYSGFGLPFALMTYFFPLLIGNGVWAMLFPLFMVTALISKPPEVKATRLRIFKVSQFVSNYIEVRLFNIDKT